MTKAINSSNNSLIDSKETNNDSSKDSLLLVSILYKLYII